MLKAASAVHVTLVRSARENERTHAALREFIHDIAPSQLQAPVVDPRVREVVTSEDGVGVIEKVFAAIYLASSYYYIARYIWRPHTTI